MPLKSTDPFLSRTDRLNPKVNPFVSLLREASESGALPLAFGPGLTSFPGVWRTKLAEYHGLAAPHRHLVVEIGCHKGQTLLAMAAAHPDVAFVGLDITFKRVVTTAQRATALGLKNVFTALANASSFDQLFAPGEVDTCVIFFPDPWVKKKRQTKNQLVNAGFCTRLEKALSPGGRCWLKTDQAGYFEAASGHLAAAGLAPESQPPPLPGLIPGDYTSTFEQRFLAQKLPTYGGKWRKPEGASALFA